MTSTILIPNKVVFASAYSAETTFTYQKDGYNYHFVFDSGNQTGGLPSGYTFNSSVLDYVIEKVGYGLNVSFAHYNGYFFDFDWDNSIFNDLFSLVQNAIAAIGSANQDLGNTSAYTYSWKFYLTGVDPNYPYPNHETYGTAYGFRFTGLTGENFDVVLDQNGNFYGSAPISNYTPIDYTDDVMEWSIHQHDQDDIWYIPSGTVQSVPDMKSPYFEGKNLVFYAYNNGLEHKCEYRDFTECLAVYYPWFPLGGDATPGYLGFIDTHSNQTHDRLYIDDVLFSGNGAGRDASFIYKGQEYSNKYMKLFSFQDWTLSINLPMYKPDSYNTTNHRTITSGNTSKIILNNVTYETCELLWLDSVSLTPAPNVPAIPVDEPIPGGELPSDPTDFDPDPDSEPDPVPGITYPGDDPVPDPEPSYPDIPPIVSGNDDLWPDVNDLITAEDSLGEYTFAIRNFEWPDFSNLMGDYLSPLIWVSTIISTLFNGSAYSIIFSVLSLMFVVAALLGILKGWTSRDG